VYSLSSPYFSPVVAEAHVVVGMRRRVHTHGACSKNNMTVMYTHAEEGGVNLREADGHSGGLVSSDVSIDDSSASFPLSLTDDEDGGDTIELSDGGGDKGNVLMGDNAGRASLA
jgi:hypothetical protein